MDQSLLRQISIVKSHCEDQQLLPLFAAAKRLVAVGLFNSHFLDGSCILRAGLSGLRHLNLSGTRVTDRILLQVLKASSELVELHLAGTRISEECLPAIIGLKKLRYIAIPPEGACGFGKRGMLEIAKNCPSLRTLDCQEVYFVNEDELIQIVGSNRLLTCLLIPYAFVDNRIFRFITDSLENLTYICVCETSVTQACVDIMRSKRPSLEICLNENHTP